jgi:hypothetical protein
MAEPIMQEDVLVNFMVGDEKVVAMAKRLAENINGVRGASEQLSSGRHFMKMADEILHLGKVMEAINFNKILDTASSATNDMLKNMRAISASAGMTSKQFAELNSGIVDAAAQTGAEFGNIAASARDLFGSTGLKEGLGKSVLDAERLGMVFDTSSGSFAKLTASMIQFGDGAVDANDVMKSFDKVTGITGKRMDDLLESVTDISKTMRNAVGSGKQFGENMKAVLTNTAQISAQFTEMGGSGASLNELMQGVMDPNKWGDIAQKMPGMAGHLFEMQQAMAAGNMDAFNAALKQGAEDTAAMGANMPAIARVASGIDFTSAEILGKIDFKKVGTEAEGTNDVMTRFAELSHDLGTRWAQFSNTLSKNLMPVLNMIIGGISKLMGWINFAMDSLGPVGGQFLAWGIVITGAMVSLLAATKMFAKGAIKAVSETAAEAGHGVGKAAGSVVGGFMEAIGKAASSIAKYAVPMLVISAALLVFAAAVYVLAKSFQVLDSVDLGHVALGLLLVIGAFAVFAIAAVLLAPVAPALIVVGLAFLVFAASVYVMAAASTILVASAMAMGEVPWSVLAAGFMELAPALLALFIAAMPWASPVGWLVSAGLALLGTSLEGVAASAQQLGMGSLNAAKGLKGITDSADKISALSGLDFTGLEKLGNAVSAYNVQVTTSISGKTTGGNAVLKGIQESIASVVNTVKSMQDFSVDGTQAILDPIREMTAMGTLFASGKDKDLLYFAATLTAFMGMMHNAAGSFSEGDFDKLGIAASKLENVQAAISHDVKISTKTGAELALEDHTAATAEHQKNVETLLADIRDGIDRINGGPGSKQVAEYNGGTPSWRPESLFSSEGESF